MTYTLCLIALALSRFLDIASTWNVSPDLKLEKNPIMRRMGWKGIIIINIPLCLIGATCVSFTVIMAVSSLIAAAFNYRLKKRLGNL